MASIPLAIRTPQIEDPMTAYGKAVSIRGALQAQQQQAQIQPLQMQEAALRVRAQEMQNAAIEQARRDQSIFTQSLRQFAGSQDGSASADSQQPAASGADSKERDVQPADSMKQAAGDGAVASDDDSSTPFDQPKSIADLKQPAASVPTMASSASPNRPRSTMMAPAAAGGSSASALVGAHPIDLVQVANHALQNGLSYSSYQKMIADAVKARDELAKMNTEELKASNQRHDAYLGRLHAFRQMPREYQEDRWAAFQRQAFTDGLLNANEYGATAQQYPTLPDADHLDMLQTGLQTLSGQQAAALKAQQSGAATARADASRSTQRKNEMKAPEIQAKTAIAQRQAWAPLLAGASTAEDYARIYAQVPDKTGLPDPTTFNPATTPQRVQMWGQTMEQKVRSDEVEESRKSRDAHDKIMEGQGDRRIGMEGQRIALEGARVKLEADRVRPGAGGLTPAQREREIDAIDAIENGKGTVSGLHAQRVTYGSYLASNKGPDGVTLTPSQRLIYENLAKTTTSRLQDVQRRKAELYGLHAPTPDVAEKIPEGQEAHSPDGHVWLKKDGVVYFVR